jgi:hypothetical protein
MDHALLLWGSGQRMLGLRWGWLLTALEVAWLATIAGTIPLLQTDHWLLIYALLAGFLIVWIGQAVAAQRAARARSGRDGGAVRLVAVVPVMILALSGFWLFGGRTASASATFQHYVSAWESSDPGAAKDLFVSPRTPDVLAAQWRIDTQVVEATLDRLADAHPDWDLETDRPYSNLHFEYRADKQQVDADRATVEVQIVRVASVPGSFFGLLPVQRSETEVLATLGSASLVRVPASGPLGGSIWLIEAVRLTG